MGHFHRALRTALEEGHFTIRIYWIKGLLTHSLLNSLAEKSINAYFPGLFHNFGPNYFKSNFRKEGVDMQYRNPYIILKEIF